MNLPNAARLALVATPLLLGGCETLRSIDFNPKPELPPGCPRAVVAEDAGRLIRFAGGGRELADVDFEAEIVDVTGTCGYDGDTVDVEMQVQIAARRGPAGKTDTAALNYFVAIARSDKTILAREAFDASIDIPNDEAGNSIIDEIDQTIPLHEDETGEDYVIIVGFELTPEELKFNREHQR